MDSSWLVLVKGLLVVLQTQLSKINWSLITNSFNIPREN